MKKIDTFYVLRKTGTDKYMPQLDGRGYTHIEFRANCIPRLFTTPRAAQCALTWWLKGPIDIDRGYSGPEQDYDEVWHFPKPEQARHVNVEIVTVQLTATGDNHVTTSD